jgi:predicted ATPase
MLLKTVFVRFYKSFNFDYLRKYHAKGVADPWELLDGMWYPYVRIPIDQKVTTIVGANESGKTHLLTAIEKGISGSGIKREDFCRYSQFFTVELGKMKWPDFGFEWIDLSPTEQQMVRSACGITAGTVFDRFLLFRTSRDVLTVYIATTNGYSQLEVMKESGEALINSLPYVFKINANIALPESVSIRPLAGEQANLASNRFEGLQRKKRFEFLEALEPINPEWFSSAQALTQSAAQIFPSLSSFFAGYHGSDTNGAQQKRAEEFNLARDLIRKVAKIDPEALGDLYNALREGNEGHANGIIQKINDALAASLNFPHWWVQDREFALMVSPREYDLVFTIRDKTGTEYSFGERSSGLRYFLSYYIQYLAHEPKGEGSEILLMDEPDAYLSSQAQQDLLKIFEAFAIPEQAGHRVQVIYVTHSPFLIDKNHAERIRVLEKGVGDEGTRVVRDASKNHYEPLRSAFGAFVGETTFIGNCNLLVEGIADQILIAGAATHLRSRGVSKLETLDLNHITIVPAGSASHIPYLVYLARGRDIERPAVIVLLDSDKSGKEAKKEMKRGGPKRKQLLKEGLILQVGDLLKGDDSLNLPQTGTLTEIEDLIPLPLCVEAVKAYLKDVCGAADDIVAKFTESSVQANVAAGKSTFDAIQACVSQLGEDLHIEKIGFARTVMDTIAKIAVMPPQIATEAANSLTMFENNMKVLFRRLSQMQREAERELTSERVSQRIDRAKRSFLRDHPSLAKREEAVLLIEEIEAALDDSGESDQVRAELQKLRRDFNLQADVIRPIDDYDKFKEAIERVKYSGRLATQVPDLDETVVDPLPPEPALAVAKEDMSSD